MAFIEQFLTRETKEALRRHVHVHKKVQKMNLPKVTNVSMQELRDIIYKHQEAK